MNKCPSCNHPQVDSQARNCSWCGADLGIREVNRFLAALPHVVGAVLVLAIVFSALGYWVSRGPEEQWVFRGERVATSPLVLGDRIVFATAERNLYGLNAADGTVAWCTKLKAAWVTDELVHSDGLLFYLDRDKVLRAVRVSNGAHVWEFRSKLTLSPPVVHGKRVLVGDGMYVRFLDKLTGKLIGSFEGPDGQVMFTPCIYQDRAILGFAETKGKRMYRRLRSSFPGGVTAVDLESMQSLWIADLPSLVRDPPHSVGELVVATERRPQGTTIRAFDSDSGEPMWETPGGETPLSLAAGLLWDARLDRDQHTGELRGVDPTTGSTVRTFSFDYRVRRRSWRERLEPLLSAIAVSQDRLYFAHGKILRAVDAETGRLIWQWKAPYPIEVRPSVMGKTVLVATTDGALYALTFE